MKRWLLYLLGLNLIAAAVVLNIRYDMGRWSKDVLPPPVAQ